MRDAWDEVDIKMHLADRYKLRAKVFYVLTLLVALVTVFFTTLESLAVRCVDLPAWDRGSRGVGGGAGGWRCA